MKTNKQCILLACGCPRSGTTALWTMLTSNPMIVLGVERYGDYFLRNKTLSEELFTYDRFFDLRNGDTFYTNLDEFSSYYNQARSRFHDAYYIGDKIPRIYESIDNIITDIPSVRIVMTLRDIYEVAMSYKNRQMKNEGHIWPTHFGVEKAVEDWNRSLVSANRQSQNHNFICVSYENMFYSDSDIFIRLYDWLGVEPQSNVNEGTKWMRGRAEVLRNQRCDNLSISDREYIKEYANHKLFYDLSTRYHKIYY